MRPLPEELRIYQRVSKLHMLPTVAGRKFYPEQKSWAVSLNIETIYQPSFIRTDDYILNNDDDIDCSWCDNFYHLCLYNN
jgi:hypothetical protein